MKHQLERGNITVKELRDAYRIQEENTKYIRDVEVKISWYQFIRDLAVWTMLIILLTS